MKKLILYFLFILQSTIVFCQINVKSGNGYIIKNDQDTLYGKIKLYPYSNLTKKVIFLENKTDDWVEYTPKDLKGFHINPKEDFVMITTEGSLNGQTVKLKYFGLKVIQGEVELIVVTLNSLKKLYFVYSDDFGLTKLEQEEKISKANSMSGKRYKETYNKYKITLGKYFYKYPVFQHRIDDTKYNYNQINRLVNDYNQKFEKKSFKVDQKKPTWHMTIYAGVSYPLSEKVLKENKVIGMVAGLRNSFYSERSNMKVEFVLGLNYRYYSFKKELSCYLDRDGKINYLPDGYLLPDKQNLTDTTIYTKKMFLYKESVNIIEFPVYIEYNNKINLISPVIRLGCVPYLVKQDVELVNYGANDSKWNSSMNFIFGLGLGLNYKRFSIKYLYSFFPIYKNTVELDFKLN